MEKYGVLEIAADYCNKGKLEEWIQLFLRNDGHNIEYFFSHVNEMMNAVDNWNPPPLIIEYKDDGSFYVCDGRHRLEMFRQKEAKSAPAIVWATGKENFDRLQEIIKC